MILLLACRSPAPPSPSGEIFFAAESETGQAVWRLSLPGGSALPVATTAQFPGPLDPKGTDLLLVAVTETPLHQESIWLLPKTGGSPRLLAPPTSRIRNPSWSPDGNALYVEADWRSFSDLYRISRSGGAPSRLTAVAGGSFEPAVSPDGTQLLYGGSRSGNADLFLMPIAGGPPMQLTTDANDDLHPRWLSISEITWLRRAEGHAQFYRMDLSTRQTRPLRPANPAEEDLDLVLSPNGSFVAITFRDPTGHTGLEVWDWKNGTRLSRQEGTEEYPAFSPDSGWLVFGSARSGDVDLWVSRVDGQQTSCLFQRPGADWLPRWAP